ncbi:MAG: hypothetical protein QM802_20735 [Agriterribacter sp.]
MLKLMSMKKIKCLPVLLLFIYACNEPTNDSMNGLDSTATRQPTATPGLGGDQSAVDVSPSPEASTLSDTIKHHHQPGNPPGLGTGTTGLDESLNAADSGNHSSPRAERKPD